MYTQIDGSQVTEVHRRAICTLLGAKPGRIPTTIILPHPMRSGFVRAVLGYLWRGAALRGWVEDD